MLRSLLGAGLLLVAQALHASPPPLEHYAQLPDVDRVTLSPDGRKIASVVRVDLEDTQGLGVQVTELDSQESDIVLFTDNSKYFLQGVHWKDSRTLLVHTFFPAERDTWVGTGQARYDTRDSRLMIVDTESGEVTTPFSRNFLRKFRIMPTGLNNIVDTLPDDPEHILLALPGFNGGPSNVVYKVNIRNQRNTIVQNSENNITSWITDRQHRIRAGRHFKDGVITTHILDPESDTWRELWPYKIFSEDQVSVAGFDHDPNIVYIRAYHQGRLALFRVNLQDPELNRELVLAHPEYDVSGGLIYSRKQKAVVGVSQDGLSGSLFFDEQLQALQDNIDQLMPSTSNYIYNLSEDMQRYMLFTTGPKDSGTYYWGQRQPPKLQAVAYRYKNLPPDVLGEVRQYNYQARDGLDIEAQLTLPPSGQAKNLPTIMFPHGGPHARDTAAFDYWAQFFASRGYAVLQMNFRGSAGQGVDFRNAGLQNWGKEMQDDIEDGARQLIEDGIADAGRICIAGASYGGYAALMGVVKTPDFYQCAISVNGVSNVFDLVRDNRAFWESYNVVDEQIGKLGGELKAISPVNHADKIKVPVLLVHGDMDRQVDIKHSEQMRDALQKADKPVTFLSLANEDHYLSNEQNRLETFRAMDQFLAEHLPVTGRDDKQE